MRLVNLIQFPREMDENWWRYGGKLVTKYTKLAENCCLVHTQHNFCTQQLRYVGITVIVILFGKSCVQKVWTNSFQEVLEAVLFGGWSIPPTAHGWLLCGSPIRVSTMFILCVGKILFELTRISNNV